MLPSQPTIFYFEVVLPWVLQHVRGFGFLAFFFRRTLLYPFLWVGVLHGIITDSTLRTTGTNPNMKHAGVVQTGWLRVASVVARVEAPVVKLGVFEGIVASWVHKAR